MDVGGKDAVAGHMVEKPGQFWVKTVKIDDFRGFFLGGGDWSKNFQDLDFS